MNLCTRLDVHDRHPSARTRGSISPRGTSLTLISLPASSTTTSRAAVSTAYQEGIPSPTR